MLCDQLINDKGAQRPVTLVQLFSERLRVMDGPVSKLSFRASILHRPGEKLSPIGRAERGARLNAQGQFTTDAACTAQRRGFNMNFQ